MECRISRSFSLFGTWCKSIVLSEAVSDVQRQNFLLFFSILEIVGVVASLVFTDFCGQNTSVVYCRQCSDAWSTAHTEFKPSSFLLVNTVNLHETNAKFACGNLFPFYEIPHHIWQNLYTVKNYFLFQDVLFSSKNIKTHLLEKQNVFWKM